MNAESIESLATMALLAVALYGVAGLVFAMVFVSRGAARLDPAAQGMPLSARLLIVPGAAALWPWLWLKWQRRPIRPGAR
jgi:hypothetical protein